MSKLTNEDLNNILVILNSKVIFDSLTEAKVGVVLDQHIQAELADRRDEAVKAEHDRLMAEAKKEEIDKQIQVPNSTENVAIPGEE